VGKFLNGRYIEPFAGSAAVLFNLRPGKAILGDVNAALIETYCAVRDTPTEVVRALRRLTVSHETYDRVRRWRGRSRATRAARFIFLNRTAFAGVYRVNRQGVFNVPYGGGGRTPRFLLTRQLLERASTVLKAATLVTCDFSAMFRRARRGDVVYCDPTYTVAHDRNGFVRYNERNFSWADQERLARCAFTAQQRGVTVLVSNAHHAAVRRLYPRVDARILHRFSCISPASRARRRVTEYLFILPGFELNRGSVETEGRRRRSVRKRMPRTTAQERLLRHRTRPGGVS
jgi:DNA adenine methylase